MSIAFGFIVSGAVVYHLETTYDNPNGNQNQMGGAFGNYPAPLTSWTSSQVNGATANIEAAINDPFQAWRLVLDSGTGSVTVTAIEGGFTESGGG